MNRKVWLAVVSVAFVLGVPALSPAAQCPSDQSGLTLPEGFCATIFADDLGHTRHMVVSPDGVLYANTWSGRYFGNGPVHEGGFLIALKDTKGAGKANVIERFGATAASGGHGGTGIALYKGYVYAEEGDSILRYRLKRGSIVPKGAPEVVISGLPLTGDHPMHPFVIGYELLSGEESSVEVSGYPTVQGTGNARRHLALRCQQARSEVLYG
jgi:glucose/arabinose dehydrogenase